MMHDRIPSARRLPRPGCVVCGVPDVIPRPYILGANGWFSALCPNPFAPTSSLLTIHRLLFLSLSLCFSLSPSLSSLSAPGAPSFCFWVRTPRAHRHQQRHAEPPIFRRVCVPHATRQENIGGPVRGESRTWRKMIAPPLAATPSLYLKPIPKPTHPEAVYACTRMVQQ